jgi:hypothetical protein
MRGAIPPLPQYAFMAWCSVKAQGQLKILLGEGLMFCETRFFLGGAKVGGADSSILVVRVLVRAFCS